MPVRQGIRYAVVVIVSLVVLSGCGGGSADSATLPDIPPTITVEPTPLPNGARLPALDGGQEVAPRDRRYSLRLPQYWIQGSAPPADIAFRESGGTPADTGYAYSVMRERLPDEISAVEVYAEAGRETSEERFADLETVSIDPIQVAGMQGVRWVYTASIASDPVLVHQVYVVDGRTGFVLTGSAPVDGNVAAARDLFNSIAGSLSFPRG